MTFLPAISGWYRPPSGPRATLPSRLEFTVAEGSLELRITDPALHQGAAISRQSTNNTPLPRHN